MTNMWMVRAGKNAILIDEFEKLNVVAIGWGLGDLMNKTPEEIRELVFKKFPNNSNQRNGKIAANEIKFRHELNVGDYVLSYNSWTREYLLGKIASDYKYTNLISNLVNEDYSDVRDVEWLCKIPRDNLKKSTQNTLHAQITVFYIDGDAKEDILRNYNNEIKQIRTLTLSKQDPDCTTYEKAIDFLSNVLINQYEGHFHYNRRPINLVGRTLILFKYEGKLIAKGIIIEDVNEEEIVNGIKYNGYYVVEKDSIEIFRESIGIKELKKYVRNIKSLNRDQQIDIRYLDRINQMIDDYSGEILTNDEYELPARIINDYLTENQLGDLTSTDTENLYAEFQSMFSPVKLKSLEGLDILTTIFPQKGNKSNLCYALEFSDEFKWLNGGIRGGSSFKFSLFKYNATNKWTTGSAKSNLRSLSEDEAIELAGKIRDAIVQGAEYVENNNLESIDDYIQFENELFRLFEESQKYCPISPNHAWIHKYYSIIFPDKFIGIHTDSMRKDALRKFRINPDEGFYANDAQFCKLAKMAVIKLYSLYDERIVRLFFDSESIWDPIQKGKLVDINGDSLFGGGSAVKPFKSDLKRNLIYFGAPGTGKSYNLNQDKDALLKNYENDYERVTFHPDYSYANFVGTYKPVPMGEDITYKYVPGPFMRILKKALNNRDKPYLLIIEEINRANVAAVFGDVFQLLDRNEENISEYDIATSEDMKTYLNEERIRLPSNLFIWATMNSADQGVFPIDTAFQRRWDFKYFSINHNEDLIDDTHFNINDETIYWNDLRKQINDELLSYKVNEDKLMGPFFAFNEFMGEEIPTETFKDIFKNKIIMYLFEDAAKPKRNDLFSGAKTKDYVTYSQICEMFDEKGLEIFCDNIKNRFIDEDEE